MSQPPHWLAEVATVVARLQPSIAQEAVGVLYAMELPVVDEPDVYRKPVNFRFDSITICSIPFIMLLPYPNPAPSS